MNLSDIPDVLRRVARQLLVPSSAVVLTPRPDGRGALTLVREGYTLHREEAPPVSIATHVFADLDSFAAYLNRHASPPTTDILFDAPTFTASFNWGNPAAPVVTATIPHTAEYRALIAAMGRPLPVAAFFEWVRTVGPYLDPIGDMPMGEFLLGQLQRIEVAQEGTLKIETQANGLVSFSGGSQTTTVSGRFPSEFTATLGVFDTAGLNPIEVQVLLTLVVRDGAPRFLLRIPQQETVERDASQDMVDHLSHLLSDGFLVGRGRHQVASAKGGWTG